MSSYRIHTSIASANQIRAVGEVLISKKWNETSKQSSRERAILLPMESVSAPEVPESFRALVESVLRSQAQEVLKTFCESNPNSMEVDSNLFTRPQLTEDFLSSGELWLSKQELETAFTASATWKRIVSRPEFATNATFQAVANHFKDSILKLSAKNVSIAPEKCDQILSKISDDDLESNFGVFVVKRLNSIRAKSSEAIDFDSL